MTTRSAAAEIVATILTLENVDQRAVAAEVARRFGLAVTEPHLQALAETTTPIAGRPGWRRDAAGREWYSAAWLDSWLALVPA